MPLGSQSALAQPAQPSAMMLAQANDRCMTTYAVRMTRTEATDEAIFASAVDGCKDLKGQLYAALDREYAATQASELKAQLDAQAQPNFLILLEKIRAGRAQRAGN
jgi:hypothetical protein